MEYELNKAKNTRVQNNPAHFWGFHWVFHRFSFEWSLSISNKI